MGKVNIAAVATEQGRAVVTPQRGVISGRALRSAKQLRNKQLAAYQSRIDRCKPGSKRHRKLLKNKAKASAKLYRQQGDILHKAFRQTVEFCREQGIARLAVGDVRDIQAGVDLRRKFNQKISQLPYGQFVGCVAYKAREYGIAVEQIPEDYSTRTCSHCGMVLKYAPRGRRFICPGCDALIHRDANGAANICSRARYGVYAQVQVRHTW